MNAEETCWGLGLLGFKSHSNACHLHVKTISEPAVFAPPRRPAGNVFIDICILHLTWTPAVLPAAASHGFKPPDKLCERCETHQAFLFFHFVLSFFSSPLILFNFLLSFFFFFLLSSPLISFFHAFHFPSSFLPSTFLSSYFFLLFSFSSPFVFPFISFPLFHFFHFSSLTSFPRALL